MAARFMIGTGNWSSTGSWSTTSGGATGAGVPTSADDVTLDSHSTALTIDATSTCKTFTEASGFVGSVTHNAFVLTVAGNVTFIAGSTYTPLATSTLTISATATLTTGGLLMPLITVSAGTLTLGDNLNFMASKVMTLTLTGALNLNGKTLSGNSSVNRVLLQSNTPGTSRTVTTTGPNFANCDYQDIQFSCASNLDLSAITGKSGDSLGNTLTGGGSTLTFTTPAAQTWISASGGNWSDVTKWTSRVPLPQDNVSFSNAFSAAQAVTADMPRLGANIDWTGATGSPTCALGNAFTTMSLYGSFNLTGAGAVTGGVNQVLVLAGRSNLTLTSAGKTIPNSMQASAPSGTYTLQDALATSGNRWTHNLGTLTANGMNVSFTGTNGAQFLQNGGTVNMGSGTWAFAIQSGTTFAYSAGTLNVQTATCVIVTASTNSRTFSGGGQAYNILQYNVANSPGPLVITGTNTFTQPLIGPGRTLTLPSATTTTIASGGTFNVNGVANGFVYLPGVSGNYISTPDSAALDITGNFTLDAQLAMASWSGPAAGAIAAKRSSSSNDSWQLLFAGGATGKLAMSTSANGTTLQTSTSSVGTGTAFSDGQIGWMRASVNVSTGGNNTVTFYTSTDGSSWSQLGTVISNVGTTSIFTTNSPLEIGSTFLGTASLLVGAVYRVRIYNSALGSSSGTPVFDANFATKTVGANSFTESSANAATVTINGTLAQVGDGRVAITAATPGSAATIAGTAAQLQNCDYLTIQDSTATPSGVFYAGHHSVSVSNVTGWTLATGFMQTITATQARTAIALKQAGKVVTASQGSTAALTKQAGKLLTATQGSTAGMVRLIGKVVSAGQATSATVTKLTRHSIAAVQGASAALTRSTSKTLATTQPTVAGLVKQTSIALSATQPQTAGIIKSVAKTLSATQSTAAGIGKSIGKLLASLGTSIAGILTGRQEFAVPDTTDYQATVVTPLDFSAAAISTGDFSDTHVDTGDFQQT